MNKLLITLNNKTILFNQIQILFYFFNIVERNSSFFPTIMRKIYLFIKFIQYHVDSIRIFLYLK